MQQSIPGKRRARKGMLTVNIGLVSNILLAGAKTTIGILGHSPALLADGVNSTSDVAYYLVVSIFMHKAHKPPDDEHPYGHRQLETIAALVVGSFVITTAVAIFWNSINNVYELFSGQLESSGAAVVALWVALITVGAKVVLTIYTRSIGNQTKNPAVLALAYDHRNDALSATAATIGIFLGRLGHPWVDPLAGALVALVILSTGIVIVRGSVSDLMDTGLGTSLRNRIRELVSPISGIEAVEELHAHRFGPYLTVNITIGVNGTLSVTDGDIIATQVEETLTQEMEFVRRVHVHYHPTRNPSTM